MDQEKFKEALVSTYQSEVLATYYNDQGISLGLLLKMVNSVSVKYAALTQITTKMQSPYSRPRLTKSILTSINNKNKVYKHFCKTKDPCRGDLLHHQFKICRHLIGNLTKISKEKFYKTYFQEYKNNLCKTWSSIKETMLVKKNKNLQPHSLKIIEKIVNDSKSLDPFKPSYIQSKRSQKQKQGSYGNLRIQ